MSLSGSAMVASDGASGAGQTERELALIQHIREVLAGVLAAIGQTPGEQGRAMELLEQSAGLLADDGSRWATLFPRIAQLQQHPTVQVRFGFVQCVNASPREPHRFLLVCASICLLVGLPG